MKTDIPAMFSITELADVLGCSRRKVEWRVETGVFQSVKIGKKRFITLEHLTEGHPQIWDGIRKRLGIMGYEIDDPE